MMKRKTYNNVLKAAKMIRAKGYDEKESYDIAIQCCDKAEQDKNGMTVEWYIEKVIDKKTYEQETRLYMQRNPA